MTVFMTNVTYHMTLMWNRMKCRSHNNFLEVKEGVNIHGK